MVKPFTKGVPVNETLPSVNITPATGTNDCYHRYGIAEKYQTRTNAANKGKPICELDLRPTAEGGCESRYRTINNVWPGCCSKNPNPDCIKTKTTTSGFGSSSRYDLLLKFFIGFIVCIFVIGIILCFVYKNKNRGFNFGR
jgi:hypothetical protein